MLSLSSIVSLEVFAAMGSETKLYPIAEQTQKKSHRKFRGLSLRDQKCCRREPPFPGHFSRCLFPPPSLPHTPKNWFRSLVNIEAKSTNWATERMKKQAINRTPFSIALNILWNYEVFMQTALNAWPSSVNLTLETSIAKS